MTNGNSFVLIIEDDDLVGKTIARTLKQEKYRAKHVNNGVDGLKVAREYEPHLIILDFGVEGIDGDSVFEEFRADPKTKDTPVLFLTAKINEDDQIRGFRADVDDYLTKPFNIDELSLRVAKILRKTNPLIGSMENYDDSTNPIPIDGTSSLKSPKEYRVIKVGEYSLDVRSYELNTPHNGKVLLTPIQYKLVYYLITHVDIVFSPARLLEEVWNFPSNTGSTDLVRVHIKNLRKIIEEDPANPLFIQTVPGYGYSVKNPK